MINSDLYSLFVKFGRTSREIKTQRIWVRIRTTFLCAGRRPSNRMPNGAIERKARRHNKIPLEWRCCGIDIIRTHASTDFIGCVFNTKFVTLVFKLRKKLFVTRNITLEDAVFS